jgi:hypothetical protein
MLASTFQRLKRSRQKGQGEAIGRRKRFGISSRDERRSHSGAQPRPSEAPDSTLSCKGGRRDPADRPTVGRNPPRAQENLAETLFGQHPNACKEHPRACGGQNGRFASRASLGSRSCPPSRREGVARRRFTPHHRLARTRQETSLGRREVRHEPWAFADSALFRVGSITAGRDAWRVFCAWPEAPGSTLETSL